tara:strand:+ start:167 stop:907 length:741 start_codon:yes stop_codon:yes gene_type:complete
MSEKNKKIYLKNTSQIKKVPKIIMQTYWDKTLIPQKVYDGIKKHCPDYEHIVYDDNECINFLKQNYSKEIVDKFKSIKKGAHKADLFRYCWLYKMGGVYLDIKIVLIKNIDKIFKDRSKLYTVLSAVTSENEFLSNLTNVGSVFQGIISTPPNNQIFKSLIDKIMITSNYKLIFNYMLFTSQFFTEVNKTRIDDRNFEKGYLFREVCNGPLNEDIKETDKYGLKCSIYDKNDERLFITRYPEYPWK